MDQTRLQEAFEQAKAAGDFENAHKIEQQLKGAQSGPVDFDTWTMVKNIPSSAARYGGDILQAVTNPVDTAVAVGQLAESFGNKTGRKFAELNTGQEMEPIEGRSELMSDAFIEHLDKRYGSVDNFQRTLMEDPVGVLADLSGAGMLSKVSKVQKIAAAVEPVNLAAKGTRQVAKYLIPEDAAYKLYQSAAKFSTTLPPKRRRAIVQTALDEGVMPTQRGLAKVGNRIDILNAQLDDLIQASTKAGTEIPVGRIFQHLNDLRRRKSGVKIEADSDLAGIDKIAGAFHRSLNGRKTVTPEELQAFKVDAYNKINWDAKRMTGSPIKEDTFKTMARGAKDAMVEAVPETADLNRALGQLYELQPHLERAANRIGNLNLIGLGTPLRTGAGGAIGATADAAIPGAMVGFMTALMDNPQLKSGVAIALNKIREGDVAWLESNIGRAETRVALALAARSRELQEYDPNTGQED